MYYIINDIYGIKLMYAGIKNKSIWNENASFVFYVENESEENMNIITSGTTINGMEIFAGETPITHIKQKVATTFKCVVFQKKYRKIIANVIK